MVTEERCFYEDSWDETVMCESSKGKYVEYDQLKEFVDKAFKIVEKEAFDKSELIELLEMVD